MTTVAKRYGVSGSFLARVCTWLNVPRPPRGYWARIAAGYTVSQPPLPSPKPGAEIEWARYGEARRAPLRVQSLPRKKKRRKRSELPTLHSLLEGFQERLNEGNVSFYYPFIKPIKRLLPDIVVTKKTASRAIDVANEFFLLLEEHNHQVMLSPLKQRLFRHEVDEREQTRGGNHYSNLWSPSRPTVVFIGTVAIGLTIYEMTEYVEVRSIDGKHVKISDLTPQQLIKAARSYSWTTTQDMPSGRLCVQAYSPYSGTNWSRQWKESKVGEFPAKFRGIVKELEAEATTIAKQVEEAERKAEMQRQQYEQQREIERQRWEVEKAEQARKNAEWRRAEAQKESRRELFDIIRGWAEANRIEEFFEDIQRRATNLPEEEKTKLLERLKLAREIIGGVDALERFRVWRSPDER